MLFVDNHMVQNLCQFLFICGIIVLHTFHISIVETSIQVIPMGLVNRFDHELIVYESIIRQKRTPEGVLCASYSSVTQILQVSVRVMVEVGEVVAPRLLVVGQLRVAEFVEILLFLSVFLQVD